MATYSISFDGARNIVIISYNSGEIIKMPLDQLLMKDGSKPTKSADFIRDQSILNYYDCIKDGTNPRTLEDLNLFPQAATANGTYPVYTGLVTLENSILNARKYNLTLTTWLKLKKGHELDPKIQRYTSVFKESGLGYETFMNPGVNVKKTFGSFIDPLSKTDGDVWPPIRDELRIEPTFMNLMGFGMSSISARADDNNNFRYEMTIGCGNACRSSPCKLSDFKVDKKYTLGNANKKSELNKSGNAIEKIKYIIVKEWGDKLQVFIYVMYSYLNESGLATMLTCDMVVFITCLIFATACIYTGALSDERLQLLTENLQGKQKEFLENQIAQRHYSIVEYISGDKFDQAINEIKYKTDKVIAENDFFIRSIETLQKKPNTRIHVGSQSYVFKEDFYTRCFTDITEIQYNANKKIIEILTKWQKEFETETNKTDDNLNRLYNELKLFESHHLLVPFIKIKGKSNELMLLGTKSYTAQLPAVNSKNSFDGSIASFQVLAVKDYRNTIHPIGGGVMRGGNSLKKADINYLNFVQDDDQSYPYTYDFPNENNLCYDNIDPEIGIHPGINLDEIYSYKEEDLLKVLTNSFNETMKRLPEVYLEYLENTIYTLFVYNSYLNGTAVIVFTEEILIQLYESYKLEDEELEYLERERISQLEALERKNRLARGTPDSPSGVDTSFSQEEGGGSKIKRKKLTRKKQKKLNKKTKNKKYKRVKTIKKNRKNHKKTKNNK